MRQLVEGPGDAKITGLPVWRVGPGTHAAIISMTGRDQNIVPDPP